MDFVLADHPAAPHRAAPEPETVDGFLFSSNEALKTAVDMWCNGESRDHAQGEFGHISTWNTSRITDMSKLFQNKSSFNDDISTWDVSSVTNMSYMFWSAQAFNQPVGT